MEISFNGLCELVEDIDYKFSDSYPVKFNVINGNVANSFECGISDNNRQYLWDYQKDKITDLRDIDGMQWGEMCDMLKEKCGITNDSKIVLDEDISFNSESLYISDALLSPESTTETCCDFFKKFKDLKVGDKIIVTDFINECEVYEVTHINTFDFSDRMRYFFAEYKDDNSGNLIDFRVDDIEKSCVVIDGCRWVYVDSDEFDMECDSRVKKMGAFRNHIFVKVHHS